MALLSLQDITKFYGRQDVLDKVSFQINSGDRVGLIGPNGAGKSTILKIILGRETPDTGEVHKVKRLRIGYLPQDLLDFTGQTVMNMVLDAAREAKEVEAELREVTLELDELTAAKSPDREALMELASRQSRLLDLFESLGGYTLEPQAARILKGLGFSEADFTRPVEELSGGWIMRAALARLLLAGPDLLLLDEPTNHLDVESLLWLEGYLKTCPSALILISHDRAFLNNVVERILEIEEAEVIGYVGNYDRYVEEKDKRQELQTSSWANQQEKIKQMERFIERGRVRASTARRVQSRIKALDKIERVKAPASQTKTIRLTLPQPARAPERLVELEGVTKAYGDDVIYKSLNLTIRRGDRIAMLGVNGAGKTTLMRLLAGRTDYQAGSRRQGEGVTPAYFAQHQLEELNPNLTVLEELATVAGDQTTGRLRSILAGFLFREDDVFKKVSVLSGGEKTRLILAKIMITAPNLLLLDEPSNHLDIPGREMLEQALVQYKGTICLISHDRRLIDAVANKIAVVDRGGVEVFPGNFEDYRAIWQARHETGINGLKMTEASDNHSAPKLSRAEREAIKKAEAEARQRLYRMKKPLMDEVESLERRLDDLNARLEEISADLALPETYQDQERSRTLNLEYSRLKAEYEQTTEAWEAAALKLEEIED